jgi:hypothetical protein
MKRFETEVTPFLRKMGNVKESDPPPMDIGLILKESFTFSPAATPGLELVDVVTNATRRALIGNLDKTGWRRIPELMIHRNENHYITLHSLQEDPVHYRRFPYIKTLNAFGRGGRIMLPANLRNKKF